MISVLVRDRGTGSIVVIGIMTSTGVVETIVKAPLPPYLKKDLINGKDYMVILLINVPAKTSLPDVVIYIDLPKSSETILQFTAKRKCNFTVMQLKMYSSLILFVNTLLSLETNFWYKIGCRKKILLQKSKK